VLPEGTVEDDEGGPDRADAAAAHGRAVLDERAAVDTGVGVVVEAGAVVLREVVVDAAVLETDDVHIEDRGAHAGAVAVEVVRETVGDTTLDGEAVEPAAA